MGAYLEGAVILSNGQKEL